MNDRKTAFGPIPLPGVTLGRVNLQDIIENRRDRLLSDLLLTVFDYALCRGMGYPCTRPVDEATAKLLDVIEQRWQAEFEASCTWVRSDGDTEPPGWLRAYAERELALGDADPPVGIPLLPSRGPLP